MMDKLARFRKDIQASYLRDESEYLAECLGYADQGGALTARIHHRASDLVSRLRDNPSSQQGLDAFLSACIITGLIGEQGGPKYFFRACGKDRFRGAQHAQALTGRHQRQVLTTPDATGAGTTIKVLSAPGSSATAAQGAINKHITNTKQTAYNCFTTFTSPTVSP